MLGLYFLFLAATAGWANARCTMVDCGSVHILILALFFYGDTSACVSASSAPRRERLPSMYASVLREQRACPYVERGLASMLEGH